MNRDELSLRHYTLRTLSRLREERYRRDREFLGVWGQLASTDADLAEASVQEVHAMELWDIQRTLTETFAPDLAHLYRTT